MTGLIATESANDTAVKMVQERMDLIFTGGSSWTGRSRRQFNASGRIRRWIDLFTILIAGRFSFDLNEVLPKIVIVHVVFIVLIGMAVWLGDGTISIHAGKCVECFRRTQSRTIEEIIRVHRAHHKVGGVADHGRHVLDERLWCIVNSLPNFGSAAIAIKAEPTSDLGLEHEEFLSTAIQHSERLAGVVDPRSEPWSAADGRATR